MTADPRDPAAAGPRERLREEALLFAQVVALAGFAFAQPVLDLYGRYPEEFVAADATRSDVVLFGLVVAFGPALVLGGLAAATRLLGERVRRAAHMAVIGLLTGLLVLQGAIAVFHWPQRANLGLALAGAVAGTALVRASRAVRLFLTFASGGPAIFCALFLLVAPSSSLIFHSGASALGPGGDPTSVLLVVFDELPTRSLLDADGQIDAEPFPNFARLAADATWYRNHTSVSTFTTTALPGILTGRPPRALSVPPTAGEYPKNLFTALAASHTLNVYEPVTSMCPRGLCDRVEGGGLREMLGEARDSWLERLRPRRARDPGVGAAFSAAGKLPSQRADDADTFGATIGASAGPRLDFAHVVLPHQDWGLLASGRSYRGEPDGLFLTAGNADTMEVIRQRHLVQLQATDAILGRMLDRLEQRGVYDDTLLVVTADHGISFRPDRLLRVLTSENPVDILYTPLLVKLPGQSEAVVDDRNAQTIDIVPTIADVVDAELPWSADGVSLLGPPRATNDKVVVPTENDELQPAEGTQVVLDGAPLFAELLASGASVPPGGDVGLRVHRHGEYAGLIGRDVADLEVGEPSSATGGFAPTIELDPAGPLVPAYLRGRLSDAGNRAFAVALDGRIAAWTHAHTEWIDPNIWLLLPEALLTPGTNRLQMYELTGGRSSPTLHPVEAG